MAWTSKDQEFLDNLTSGIERMGRDEYFAHYCTKVQDSISLIRIPDADRLRHEDPRMWVHLQGWLVRHHDLPERTRQHICEHERVTTEPDGSVTCDLCHKNAEVCW